jgi:predicted aspartyl protease
MLAARMLAPVVLALVAALGAAPGALARGTDRATPSADIPIQVERGNIVVDVELQPGHTLPFVFDTGLSHGNLVTPQAAARAGLEGGRELDIGDATGDVHRGRLLTVPRVRIGEAQLADQPYAIVDIPAPVTARPGKPPVAGFIGAPLLRDAVLCVDYGRGRLQRWPRTAFQAGELETVPMKLRRELPTLQVSIDGQRATLVVDTGSNGAITVYPAFARRAGFERRYPDLAPQRLGDGSGEASSVLVAEAAVVEIAPGAVFHHVPIGVIPQGMDPAWGIDGMIGYLVLSQLNPCLDRDGERFLFDAE